MNEIWKDINGFEGLYQISNLGQVKSLKRKVWMKRNNCYKIHNERILKQAIISIGYMSVNLSKNGKSKQFSVHQLVAISFLGHEPCGFEKVVDHINNIKTDNRAENLQIISQRQNTSKNKTGNSKYVGVFFIKSSGKFQAQIQINGKHMNLGKFHKEIDAHNEYQRALNEYNTKKKITRPNIKIKTSKYKGVYWNKEQKKWHVQININGKMKHIGFYNNEKEASEYFIIHAEQRDLLKQTK